MSSRTILSDNIELEFVMSNIFANLPNVAEREVFDDLLSRPNIRIERIVSQGHCSPADGWYDQDENEWVIVLEGAAVILLEEGNTSALRPLAVAGTSPVVQSRLYCPAYPLEQAVRQMNTVTNA